MGCSASRRIHPDEPLSAMRKYAPLEPDATMSKLFQGRRGSMMLTPEAYNEASTLWDLMRPLPSGLPPVKLIRSDWLESQAARLREATTDEERARLALPHRQILENMAPEAFIGPEEIEKLPLGIEKRSMPIPLPILCVSHCWATAQHPDPLGHTVVALADAIKREQSVAVSTGRTDAPSYKLMPPTMAIFLDWCSLCQKDVASGERTPEEKEAFHVALSSMQAWYAHAKTTTFLMTAATPGSEGTPPYAERGWPTFESQVSMIAKSNQASYWPMVVDVGSESGSCHRPAPPMKAEFAQLLSTKTFSNGKSDCEMVTELYWQTVEALMETQRSFSFNQMGWTDADLRQFCRWLPHCRELTRIRLNENPQFTDAGLAELAATLRDPTVAPKLKRLTCRFDGTEYLMLSTPEGTEELREVCKARHIEFNPISRRRSSAATTIQVRYRYHRISSESGRNTSSKLTMSSASLSSFGMDEATTTSRPIEEKSSC